MNISPEVTENLMTVLRKKSESLIQAEINSLNERNVLEAAVAESVAEGIAVENISAATGLEIDEIDKIFSKKQDWDSVDERVLFGV